MPAGHVMPNSLTIEKAVYLSRYLVEYLDFVEWKTERTIVSTKKTALCEPFEHYYVPNSFPVGK